jgi:mono/diheme cytochrome c family protein
MLSEGSMTRRDLFQMIGAVAGAAVMDQVMVGLGMATESGYQGPIKLPGDPKGATVVVLGAAGYVVLRVLNGHGGMPSFGDQLSDQQVAALATFIRTSFGNHRKDRVTPDQVKTLRYQLHSEQGQR